MKTREEMRDHLIAKAGTDEAFREKLLSDPRTSIEAEFGITIPQGMTVQVHENTGQQVHLVLPPATKLSDVDLRAASGGEACGPFCRGGCGY